MNDLIQTLVERTTSYVPDAKPGDAAFMEKFAQLVASECEAEIINWLGYAGNEQDDGLRKAADTIIKLFHVDD